MPEQQRFEGFTGVVPTPGKEIWVDFPDAVYPDADYPDSLPLRLHDVLMVINSADEPKKDKDGNDVGLSYIVYTSPDDPHVIHYATGPGHRPEGSTFNSLWARSTDLTTIEKHNLEDSEVTNFIRQIGNAIGNGLEGDSEGMGEGLDRARAYAQRLAQRRTRWPYLLSVILAALVLGAIGLYLIFQLCDAEGACGCTGSCQAWERVIAVGLLGGSLGSLLFSAGMKRMPFDPFAKPRYVSFEGVLRVLFGVAGGIVAALGVVAGVVTTELVDKPESNLLFLGLVGIAGGYSERLAPALLRKVSPEQE